MEDSGIWIRSSSGATKFVCAALVPDQIDSNGVIDEVHWKIHTLTPGRQVRSTIMFLLLTLIYVWKRVLATPIPGVILEDRAAPSSCTDIWATAGRF